jgi:hypothetical protein
MAKIQKIAVWWFGLWICLSLALLIACVWGMIFMPGATPNPNTYPARFGVLALAAIVTSLPGWVAMMVSIIRR